ncbi:GIY-YIG nuclease family protein [Mucilaginibacter paludis]|uniref:Excinuclease ABC C subunit domain protein n=1 Tax=Mucilaginibacter paludis DSM 18603 TaxID=714943 RepID=H1Y756_9SPHI|nr:GIY-YIG nuclease family protein [Mucilaginibacter paludis]EHQ28675.1 Excinuclease ABC C subunit domain protein [Mucilaginibacter paludis DSM 18603]
MKTYYVYILLCNDGSYYTGVTNNIELRLDQHQSGIDPKAFTYKRRPVKLVFSQIFQDINFAIDFEKQVKGWRREKKEAIINGDWDKLPELSTSNKINLVIQKE